MVASVLRVGVRLEAGVSLLNTLIAIGALLAAIVVPLYVLRQQRSYKELTYETFPPVGLLSVRKTIKDRVEIKIDGELVEAVEGVAVYRRVMVISSERF
jgi:hypothetical protein